MCLCAILGVAPFKSDLISESVLQRLIKQDIVVNYRFVDRSLPSCYLYKTGTPCDFFIMILQGRVQVEFGKENLVFEGGPFVPFGVDALGKKEIHLFKIDLIEFQFSSDLFKLMHACASDYILTNLLVTKYVEMIIRT